MEINELKKTIKGLPKGEVKTLLFHILLRVDLLKETEYSEAEFINDVKEIYRTILDLTNERSEINKEGTYKRVHILFGDASAGILKIALKNLGVYKEENVISFRDMFSVGLVWRLHEETGKEARFDWMKNNMNDEYDDFYEYKQRFQKTIDQIKSISENTPITIWIAENSHEQTGLRLVLHLLKERSNDINLINTTKVFAKVYSELLNERKVKYTVLHTGEIPPEKLQLIYKQSKHEPPLSQHEREDLEQEWLSLAENRELLRIWRNGRIQSVPDDYYDQYIINKAKKLYSEQKMKDFMKSAKLIGEVLAHLDQYVGAEFLEYRVRKLIEKGVFEVETSQIPMRFYSVRFRR